MRKLFSLIAVFFTTNLIFKLKPEYKKVFKLIIFLILAIFLIFYFHNEYLNWSRISKLEINPTYSYLVKNILIVFVIILTFLGIKKSKNRNDGYDKFREIPTEDLSKEIIKNYKTSDKINETEEEYFNYFKNKKNLRSLSDIKFKNEKK